MSQDQKGALMYDKKEDRFFVIRSWAKEDSDIRSMATEHIRVRGERLGSDLEFRGIVFESRAREFAPRVEKTIRLSIGSQVREVIAYKESFDLDASAWKVDVDVFFRFPSGSKLHLEKRVRVIESARSYERGNWKVCEEVIHNRRAFAVAFADPSKIDAAKGWKTRAAK